MKFSTFDFTLRQLQYVVAVAETSSFRQAAERCHVSQPSLSAQVAEVERALGGQLFERERRGTRPTAMGEIVVERARQLLIDAEALETAVRLQGDPLDGVIRLGVIPTIAPYLLPNLDPALRQAFPRLVLHWTEERTANLVARIDDGELDGALVALEAELGGLAHATLGTDPFLLATAPDHTLAAAEGPLPLHQLEAAEVLLLDDGHCLRDQALPLCAANGAREVGFRATSLATLVQMVAGSKAVTLLPRMAVEVENRHGAIAIRSFDEPPARTIVVVWRPSSALGSAMRRIAEVGRRLFEAAV